MGAHNPYDNFPEIHRGRSFSKDFERIDTLKMGDKILVEDARTGRVMYCYVNQLKEIDPEFGEYLKTASISDDGSTLTLTKSDGTQIVFHGGSGSAEGAVRFDKEQTLTEAQKGVARGNIGAISTSEMTNAILAEQTRAENAESALSARIDTIIQGRNVRDIVGNYDELLAYDTSTLGDNDIVMVLLDATKSGHTTYYRWKEAEGEWEFIGGLAFSYTKTEIDEKFAALHIVLPTIPTDAVENPEDYQELLAQVDGMVRSAGSDASFKMPVLVVDGISGNVDVTFVKSNPAHLYLGIFADDMSTLYHITRTTSTPRTYILQIVEKVFATEAQATALANDAISDALDEDAQGAIIEAIKAHHDDTKADQVALDEVKLVAEYASRTAETASQGVSEAKSELTELQLKVGELEPASATALPEAVEGVTTLVRNTTYGSPASPITLSGTMQIAYPTTTDHSEAVLYCVIAEGANITFNGTHYNEPSTDATTIIALARDNAWYFGAFQTA